MESKKFKISFNYLNNIKTKKQLKILVDVTNSHHGGGATYLQDLVKCLDESKNVVVHTLTLNDTNEFDFLGKRNITIKDNVLFRELYIKNTYKNTEW